MKKYQDYLLYLAWFISLISLLGSLFFSEVLKLPPCLLCWYQRIFMYPQVFLITVGILRKDKNLPWYVLPLTLIGSIIAFYHNLLYFKIIPESLAPCIAGVSCTTRQIELLGFITIPLLSLVSFVTITILMFLYLRYNSRK